MVYIKPNNAYTVEVVSKYMSSTNGEHQQVVKWILRYLKGTQNLCLRFGSSSLVVNDYVDTDYASQRDKEVHYKV